MNAINGIMQQLTGLMMAPFRGAPLLGLIVISSISGVLAAIAFRYTSPQGAIKRAADEVWASMLAMRLYKDSLWVLIASQGRLLKASLARLVYSMPPLIVLLPPFALLLGQMAMYYEFAPLPVDSGKHDFEVTNHTLVRVQVNPEKWGELADLELAAPEGVQVLAGVRDEHDHSITWRILPTQPLPDDSKLELRNDGQVVAEKRINAVDDASRLTFSSPIRPSGAAGSWYEWILFPGEPAFSTDSPVQAISINYPSRVNTVFGLHVHWVITFFIVSILAALAAKPLVKVQF